jgi:photosystem I subunit 3
MEYKIVKKWISSLLLCLFIMLPLSANADVAGLVPCKNSKEFAKRLDGSVKKLESRLTKYEAGTPPALALEKQIEKTKGRFAQYGEAGLLCGTDGLPHLIADGRWSHSGEFVIPGILFLYIAGWIGWVGRSYVLFARGTEKPTEKEIIIDVPVALSFVATGFVWPVAAFKEFTSGKLIVPASEITVSPR